MRMHELSGEEEGGHAPGMGLARVYAEEARMSAVVKSWVRIFCPKCKERQTYVLQEEWRLVCTACGHERSLRRGVLGR